MNKELLLRLVKIEKRLDVIENRKKNKILDKTKLGKNYNGLAGGIRYLIDNKRLVRPKSVAEIYEELKKRGYHYPKKSVEKLLKVNFMKNSKLLNRIKENNKWKYVIRK